MIVDGKALAEAIGDEIKARISELAITPRAVILTCQPTFETQKYLAIKQRQAANVGITLHIIEIANTATIDDVAGEIHRVKNECDSIIIQLPFPHLATATLVELIPASHDADVFRYAGDGMLPPVIGAIDEIARRYDISWAGQSVVVVGEGRLVGRPAAVYAKTAGANVTILTKESFNQNALKVADVVILGAGVPGLLTPDMVKPNVIVFDAGTSEEGGVLVGDADPAVADTAALFTPVPGGIGPVAVASLLKNVLYCALSRRNES